MSTFNSNIVKADAVIAAAKNYLPNILVQPYNTMATSVLIDPNVFQYSELGESTILRYVTGGTFGDYDGSWDTTGTMGTVAQKEFKATIDRKSVTQADWKTEADSILKTGQLSSEAVVKATWRKFAQEADMRAFSTIYAGSKEANRHKNTENGYKTDPDNILATLVNVRQQIFENEIDDTMPVYCFVDSETYANIQYAMISKYALGQLIRPAKIPVNVLPDYVADNNGLTVLLDVLEFNNMYIIKANKNRMKTLITSLDGKSSSQEAGGVVADDSSTGAADIKILAVPKMAAAVSVRHIVNLFMSPLLNLNANASLNTITEPMNKLLDGTGNYINIGVNQQSDKFKYVTRILFGVPVIDGYSDGIVAVTTTPVGG